MISGQTLEEFLRDRRDDTLLVVSPAGNPGDDLLRSGFRKMADEVGITYHRFGDFQWLSVIDIIGNANPLDVNYNVKSMAQSTVASALWAGYKALSDVDLVYIHGGAHFSDVWGSGIGCFRTAAKLFDCDIIVGPQSCVFADRSPAKLFEEVDNSVHFFCREEYTHEIMDTEIGDCDNVTLYLSQDTAFYLDERDLIVEGCEDEYLLISKRTDKESAGPFTVDVAPDVDVVREDISSTRDSLSEFLRAIEKARRVYTDRLHVAVPAVMIGKPTTLFTNSYHKNTGVFEYSLSDYDNIEYIDREQATVSA